MLFLILLRLQPIGFAMKLAPFTAQPADMEEFISWTNTYISPAIFLLVIFGKTTFKRILSSSENFAVRALCEKGNKFEESNVFQRCGMTIKTVKTSFLIPKMNRGWINVIKDVGQRISVSFLSTCKMIQVSYVGPLS